MSASRGVGWGWVGGGGGRGKLGWGAQSHTGSWQGHGFGEGGKGWLVAACVSPLSVPAPAHAPSITSAAAGHERRLVDEIVWVKMTVNRRLAKSHGFYLQHAKEVRGRCCNSCGSSGCLPFPTTWRLVVWDLPCFHHTAPACVRKGWRGGSGWSLVPGRHPCGRRLRGSGHGLEAAGLVAAHPQTPPWHTTPPACRRA